MNISINDIIKQSKKSLSASQYVMLYEYKNKNKVLINEYDDALKNYIVGNEPASKNYIDESKVKMIKTKAITDNQFILFDSSLDSIQSINPSYKFKHNLKKGDILFLKDGEPGRCIMMHEDLKNYYICSGIIIIRIDDEIKRNYLFAFLKSKYFKEQRDLIIPPGSTFKHRGEEILEQAEIYLPNYSAEDNSKILKYVSELTNSIVAKESEIKKKYNDTICYIDSELENNQKNKTYINSYPSINELMITTRLDSSLYTKEIKNKEFLIKNYTDGYYIFKISGKIGSYVLNLIDSSNYSDDSKFSLRRGKDLGYKYIGKSLETDEKRENYYTLIKGGYLSTYGTIEVERYLGCKVDIFTLKRYQLILSVTGALLGKSYIFIDEPKNTILNINSVILTSMNSNLIDTIYLKQCLDYLRKKDLLSNHSVGSNGGSLAPYYMNGIVIPKLSESKKKQLSLYYYNEQVNKYELTDINNLKDFIEYDREYTNKAGIYSLDKSRRQLKNKLDKLFEKIVNNAPIEEIEKVFYK